MFATDQSIPCLSLKQCAQPISTLNHTLRPCAFLLLADVQQTNPVLQSAELKIITAIVYTSLADLSIIGNAWKVLLQCYGECKSDSRCSNQYPDVVGFLLCKAFCQKIMDKGMQSIRLTSNSTPTGSLFSGILLLISHELGSSVLFTSRSQIISD